MKKTTLFLALVFAASTLIAQKKTTTSAVIVFDATTSKDALPKAENRTVVAALDTKTGVVAFEAIMKSFAFSNPTIQDHFNGEKWLHTDQFPTSVFKGKINNLSAINFKKDGTYNAEIEGDLTIRGKKQPVKTNATIVVKGKQLNTSADFNILLENYDVKGGAIAAGKVAKETKISVTAELK